MSDQIVGFGPPTENFLNEYELNEINALISEKQHRHIIEGIKTYGPNLLTYTVLLDEIPDIEIKALEICRLQSRAFKFQCNLGYILKDISTNELKFWYASFNTSLFPEPISFTIRSRDLTVVSNTIRDINWDTFFSTIKSNLVVQRIIYGVFYCFLMTPLIRCGCNMIKPPFISNSIFIIDPCRPRKNKKCNNLCLIKCCVLWKERFKNSKKNDLLYWE